MIPASVLLLGWNEYRTVHRTKGLLEGKSVVVPLESPESIEPQNAGKLIHVAGLATTEETLSDKQFAVAGQFLRIRRNVEMYQWVEREEKKTRKKLGGGEETVKTYTYDKKWKSGRESSESFKEPNDHVNPQPKFSHEEHVANRATFGAFQLRSEQVNDINNWREWSLDQDNLLEKFDPATRDQFKVQGAYLYYRPSGTAANVDTNSPQVGDLRIRFDVVEPTQISQLGKQEESTITAFQTSNGEKIELLKVGKLSATEMFASLERENTFFAMLLRAAGWILSIVGFSLIAGPLKTLGDIVPFVGNLVGTATFFIALILGTCSSLVTISVAWIAVRPLYSVGVLVLVGVSLLFLFKKNKKNQPATEQLPMAQFVD
jgi:Transmembrane protein 43